MASFAHPVLPNGEPRHLAGPPVDLPKNDVGLFEEILQLWLQVWWQRSLALEANDFDQCERARHDGQLACFPRRPERVGTCPHGPVLRQANRETHRRPNSGRGVRHGLSVSERNPAYVGGARKILRWRGTLPKALGLYMRHVPGWVERDDAVDGDPCPDRCADLRSWNPMPKVALHPSASQTVVKSKDPLAVNRSPSSIPSTLPISAVAPQTPCSTLATSCVVREKRYRAIANRDVTDLSELACSL